MSDVCREFARNDTNHGRRVLLDNIGDNRTIKWWEWLRAPEVSNWQDRHLVGWGMPLMDRFSLQSGCNGPGSDHGGA